jgi:hypothetical protein
MTSHPLGQNRIVFIKKRNLWKQAFEFKIIQRGHKVTGATLNAASGQLDNDFHYPVSPLSNKYPPFSLCLWVVTDGDSRDSMVHGASGSTCVRCNISLCISCIKPFHIITDLNKFKSAVKNRNEEKKNNYF